MRENTSRGATAFDIVQFRVAATARRTLCSSPQLRSVARIPESASGEDTAPDARRTMDKVQQSMGMMLNKTPWHMPVTEKPVLNTTEIWELVNLTEDAHPIHLHLVRFQFLDRRPFDAFAFQDKGTVRFTGARGARRRGRLEGHRACRPRSDHAHYYPLRRLHRPIRLALPHPRARRQRDDAALRSDSRARVNMCRAELDRNNIPERLMNDYAS